MVALETILGGLLDGAVGAPSGTPALVLYDRASPLAVRLAAGYRAVLPGAEAVEVLKDELGPARAAVDRLPAGALVVLVQSTRFALTPYRPRLALFKRGLVVVDHPHLGRVRPEEVDTYLAALEYDPAWYRGAGHTLRERLRAAGRVVVRTAAGALTWGGPFEDPKLNVGDYAGREAVGGQFPIGEVFTELVDLEGLDGEVALDAYGAEDFSVAFVEPCFGLRVRRGRVTDAPGAPPAFAAILDAIAAAEGEVWVRELGLGLNRALGPSRRLSDVSAYERRSGVHLSLGAKHAVYPKPGFSRRHTRFHVDVFVAAPKLEVDGEVLFEGGWRIGPAPT